MGRKWNPESIPESTTVPIDTYRLKITDLGEVEGGTKGGEKAKLPAGCCMYKAEYEIIEPVAFMGLHLRDQFVIGSAADQDARDPKTWEASIGAKQLKKMLKAARVSLVDDLDEACQAAVGNELVAFVSTRRDGDNEYNDVKRYYAIGERVPGSGDPKPGATPSRPTAPPPSPPASPTQTHAATGNGEAKAVGRTAATAKAAGKVKTVEVDCPSCGVKVPREGFVAHMDAHEAGEAVAESS